jgi:hypothetical protein
MVVAVFSESSYTAAIAIEDMSTPALVMQCREWIITEPHASENVRRFAALSRVAAGFPADYP